MSILESWLLLCLSSYEMGDDAIVPFWWSRMPVWPPFLAMMQLLTEPWINWWISRSSPRVGSQNTHYSDGLRDLGEPQQARKVNCNRLEKAWRPASENLSGKKVHRKKKYIGRIYIYIYVVCDSCRVPVYEAWLIAANMCPHISHAPYRWGDLPLVPGSETKELR